MLTVRTFPFNPLSTNCYVVSDETQEAVIIDCGAHYDAEKQALADYIGQAGRQPVAHLLTHAHFDHLWGAAFIHDRYGLAARCSEADLPLFIDAPGQTRSILGHAMRCSTGPAGPTIAEDGIITFGSHSFTVIPCPGHTPGGLCFYCAAEKVLFSGDSLFQMSIGRTDLPGGNHWALIRSLHHMLKNLPDDVVIYPGHGPKTKVSIEREHNPYLAY